MKVEKHFVIKCDHKLMVNFIVEFKNIIETSKLFVYFYLCLKQTVGPF